MTTQPPFALFVTAKDLPIDYINECLTRAWKGDDEAAWELFLVNGDYDKAPKRRTDNELPEGTKAPVTSFESPFLGKTPEECAAWLQAAPEDVPLNRRYFAVINEHDKEGDTITMCQVDEDKGGDVKYFPVPVGEVVMLLSTNDRLKFAERLQGYQTQRKYNGKPDRSKGKPYGHS